LDLLLATTPTIAFTLNDQGVFIMVEGRGLAETGLTANAFVGTSVFEMGMVYPTILANIRSALAGRSCTALEAGLGCTFETSYHPLYDHHQRVIGVIGVGVDVTKQTSLVDGAARLRRSAFPPDMPTLIGAARIVEPIIEDIRAMELKPREIEILRCVAQGMTNRRIAVTLCVEPSTVKWYLDNLYRKLHVPSRAAAVAWAQQHGVL